MLALGFMGIDLEVCGVEEEDRLFFLEFLKLHFH